MVVSYKSQDGSCAFFSPKGNSFEHVPSPEGDIIVARRYSKEHHPVLGYVGSLRPETLILGHEEVLGSENQIGMVARIPDNQRSETEKLLDQRGYKPPFVFW